MVAAIFRLVLNAGVAGCIGLSCYFAFEFGWSRGTDPISQWAFGLSAGFLDFCKAVILLMTADSLRGERRAAIAGYCFLTCLSLWCAYGNTATHLAERISNRVVAAAQQSSKQATLDRVVAQRKAIGNFKETIEEAVKVAAEAVKAIAAQAEAERSRGYCGKLCRDRESDERAARATLLLAQTNRAATISAAELDAKIAAAELALANVDIKTATKHADPQAENMAKAIGVSEALIALVSHALFAISIEIGSGLMPWLLWGHRRREDDASVEPTASTALTVPEPIPLVETPESVRQRFFDEVVIPSDQYVPAAKLYMAYARWCMERGFNPMGAHAFGRAPPWGKEKIGGQVRYLNCSLAEAYNAPQLRLAVSNP